MSTSLPSPSITYSPIDTDHKNPIWDFTQTTAYPVELQRGNGKVVLVYVYLTPYTPDELKIILRKGTSGYKREKRDVEIVREDRNIYTPLCDKHFVKLGNATGTPEAQREWLDKYPEFKPGIVEHTFGGLRIDQKIEDTTEDVLDISAELSGQVKVYQDLYDEASESIVRVNMAHNYSHPTEAQYREFRNSRRNKFLRKSSLWTIAEEHGTLEKLYDAVIRSIDGAITSDHDAYCRCTPELKATWLPFVPLWHKLWVVEQIFGELVEKND